jgi:hypothetical protein
MGGADGRPASIVDAARLRIGYSFSWRSCASFEPANTPSIFFDDQTRQPAPRTPICRLLTKPSGDQPPMGWQIVSQDRI